MQTFIDGSSAALHAFAVAHSWVAPLVIWGTAGFIVLCPVGFFLLWVWDGRLRPGVAALVGLGLTQWASHEMGRLTYRPRPFVAMHFTPLYPHLPNNSFPSTLTAFAAVAGLIGVLAWRRVGLVFVVGTVVVGFGCVYVGVHYATDVIVGAVLGAVCAAVAWLAAGVPPVTSVLGAIERRLPQRRRRGAPPRVAARAAS
ncbi:MAG: phosphatase PAP2 family protein [Candidatus Dormibacteria bacterium]